MQELAQLGLTPYEIKVYLTLLKEGTLKGGEISRKSGVPNGRTYDVLHKLKTKGFVEEIITTPKLFKAVPPKIATALLIHSKKQQLTELEHHLPDQLNTLTQLHPPSTQEKITLLHGKHLLPSILKQEHALVKKTFKRMFTFEYMPYDLIRAEQQLMKRGVTFKILGTLLTPTTLKFMKQAKKIGYDVRYYPVEELRLSIIDHDRSMINLVNKKSQPKQSSGVFFKPQIGSINIAAELRGMSPNLSNKNHLEDRTILLIESKELTRALEHYFDTLWKKAKKITTKSTLTSL